MTLREALWESVRERQKLVATEAFPKLEPGRAASELAKILGDNADRGDSVFAVLESVLRFGDREKLRAYFDGRLRPGVETTLRELDRMKEIQLGLFEPLVKVLDEARRLRDQLEEEVQRAPFEKKTVQVGETTELRRRG